MELLMEIQDIKSYMLENGRSTYSNVYHPENNVWFYFIDLRYDYTFMFKHRSNFIKEHNVCLGIYDVSDCGMISGYIKDWNPQWNYDMIYACRYKDKYLYLVRKEDYKEEYDKELSDTLIDEFVEYVKTN